MARLRVSELTGGEKLYIYRTREGKTQFEKAVELGMCMAQYRSMELDHTRAVYVSLGKLEEHEAFTLLRRRKGLTKVELAERIGVSSYWLGQMEAGTAPIDRLRRFWEDSDALED